MNYIYTKDERITGKYVSFYHLEEILKDYSFWRMLEGTSENGLPIPLYRIGEGNKRILLWSQMHGNESTTTRALVDILKLFSEQGYYFSDSQLYIIPMLNPDGANLYTRENFNKVDLNRDAINLSQKESQFLRRIFEEIKPAFCFNLHDQRTIFGVKDKPATISFLAPAVDESRSITIIRKKAMEVITKMNCNLQKLICNCVGRFDDSFNPNCTGDQFSLLGTPTILIESGFYPNDYLREQTRKYIALSILEGLKYINDNNVTGTLYQEYFQIPENRKNFCDYCIINDKNLTQRFYIQLEETLYGEKVTFSPKLLEIGNKQDYYAHHTYMLSEVYNENNCNIDNIISHILAYIEDEVKKI
jgi:peptidase M14, carboxypeptidase A